MELFWLGISGFTAVLWFPPTLYVIAWQRILELEQWEAESVNLPSRYNKGGPKYHAGIMYGIFPFYYVETNLAELFPCLVYLSLRFLKISSQRQESYCRNMFGETKSICMQLELSIFWAAVGSCLTHLTQHMCLGWTSYWDCKWQTRISKKYNQLAWLQPNVPALKIEGFFPPYVTNHSCNEDVQLGLV